MPAITLYNVCAGLLFGFITGFAWHFGAKVAARLLP